MTPKEIVSSAWVCTYRLGVVGEKKKSGCLTVRQLTREQKWWRACAIVPEWVSLQEWSSSQAPPAVYAGMHVFIPCAALSSCCLRWMKSDVLTKLEGEFLLFKKGPLRKKLSPGIRIMFNSIFGKFVFLKIVFEQVMCLHGSKI